VNIGITDTFKIPNYGAIQVRFDVVNIFDRVYEIRSGSGVGVGAPQFGQPVSVYGGVGYYF
jgi:hypothetical protein